MTAARPNYWVVKGNKNFPNPTDTRFGDIEAMFDPEGDNEPSYWFSKKRLPDGMKPLDRLFFWSSSPDRFFRGVGELVQVRKPHAGEYGFDVRFMASIPSRTRIDIGLLRGTFRTELKYTDDRLPTFLKPAVVATVYPLRQIEAAIIKRLILQQPENSSYKPLADVLVTW